MPLEKWLPIASFAIALGGLARLLLPQRKTRDVVLTTVITALLLLSGVTVYRTHRHAQRVRTVSREIVALLGDDVRAFDQLYEALYYVEAPVVNEALDDLIARGRVGHRVLELRDYQGATFRVRGYYARPAPSQTRPAVDRPTQR